MTTLAYAAKVQYTKQEDKSWEVTKEETHSVQQAIITFLFYGRTVYGSMLMVIIVIASHQAATKEETMTKTKKFWSMRQHIQMPS